MCVATLCQCGRSPKGLTAVSVITVRNSILLYGYYIKWREMYVSISRAVKLCTCAMEHHGHDVFTHTTYK